MATSTISNTIKDPAGTAVASVIVTATLMPTAGFRSDVFTEVARVVTTTSDVNGAWSLALERNSNITPANTYYEVVEQIPVAQGGTRVWTISVGASDQTVLAALVSSPPAAAQASYLTQAAADARYQALGSLGSGTPATIVSDGAGTAGVSTSGSRADHNHPIVNDTPVATGDANAEGTSNGFARGDHVHKGVVSNDAWTAYTPTLSNVTLGNGTLIGKWVRAGRTIHFRISLTWGSTTSASGLQGFGLPVAMHAEYGTECIIGTLVCLDAGLATYQGFAQRLNASAVECIRIGGSGSAGVGITATAPFTWGTGDQMSISGTYEAAS